VWESGIGWLIEHHIIRSSYLEAHSSKAWISSRYHPAPIPQVECSWFSASTKNLFCVERQSEIGKNEGEAFQAVLNLVCDLAFSPSPSLPSWAPRDWRWLGLRYKLTEVVSFDKSSKRSRWRGVFTAIVVCSRRVGSSIEHCADCSAQLLNDFRMFSNTCRPRPPPALGAPVRAWRVGSNYRLLDC